MNTATVVGDTIVLSFDFNWQVVNAVKDIQGRKYNPNTKTWVVPNTAWHCSKVLEVLAPFSFSFDESIRHTTQKPHPEKHRYPKGLYPFQRRGVDFLFETGGRAIVADDMGLGKSAESLVYVELYGGKTLIVAPASVIFKWAEKECPMWLPDRSVSVVTTGKQEIEDTDVVIMSYAIMVAQKERLKGIPFNSVIFDECHYLKSMKSLRNKAAREVVKGYVPHIILLSGTPFMNRPTELFPLLNMLDPAAFGSYAQFAQRYAGAVYENKHWFFPDIVTNTEELAERLHHYMIRRTKREVALELPELKRTAVPIEIANRSDYTKAVKDMRAWLAKQNMEVLNPNHVLTRLNVLRQIVGLGKVDAAVELAEGVLQSGRKVVLFAHHKQVVEKLFLGLREYGVLTITGDVENENRIRNSKEFLDNQEIRVMIISVAGAEGIDLYSAADIIFVEREWVPAKEEQAEARLHRIGQKNNVMAYYVVAKRTVDEKLNAIVERKRSVFGAVIGQDEIVTQLLEELE